MIDSTRPRGRIKRHFAPRPDPGLSIYAGPSSNGHKLNGHACPTAVLPPPADDTDLEGHEEDGVSGDFDEDSKPASIARKATKQAKLRQRIKSATHARFERWCRAQKVKDDKIAARKARQEAEDDAKRAENLRETLEAAAWEEKQWAKRAAKRYARYGAVLEENARQWAEIRERERAQYVEPSQAEYDAIESNSEGESNDDQPRKRKRKACPSEGHPAIVATAQLAAKKRNILRTAAQPAAKKRKIL